MRSLTAEEIYKDDSRFEVKSAGTDIEARIQISRELLSWADCIVVMEKHHRSKIRKKYPDIFKNKTILCMYIEDEYDYMDEDLIELLRTKFESLLALGLC